MKNIDIKNIVGISYIGEEETNPYYDSYRTCNGGGYSQPMYTFCVYDAQGNELEMTVEDTSCGDFGTRFSVTISDHGESVCSAYWGTMVEMPYSEFNWNMVWFLEYVVEKTHIYIPLDVDIEEKEEKHVEEIKSIKEKKKMRKPRVATE